MNLRPILFLALCVFGSSLAPLRGAEVIPPGNAPVFNHARFFPAPYRAKSMIGGRFSGSNVSEKEGFVVLAEIKTEPREGEWTDLVFSNNRLYRWLRYEAPPGSHGHIAELEFYAGTRKLDGLRFTAVSGEREGRAWRFAFDGDPATWVDSEDADGQFAGVDLREAATARSPRFSPPPSGIQQPVRVLLNGLTPYATIRYTLDGSRPTATTGRLYERPFSIEQTTTVTAASFVEGWAASPPLIGTYIIGEAAPGLRTLHLGNSLTDIAGQFSEYARTAGRPHVARTFTIPGATTKRLLEGIGERKSDWQIATGVLEIIDHVTFQPRDFNVAQEAESTRRFLEMLRQKSPQIQPWLYAEWVERTRPRPSDRGEVPSSQMTRVFPALTWEESMGAMLLYVEEVQRQLATIDADAKPARVLPTNLAFGWIRHQIERGAFPDTAPGQFYPLLFRDSVHPNANGSYLVDLTWYAAFYGESPEGKVLPIATDLTPAQTLAMQRLAWEVVRHYPGAGLFQEGRDPVEPPRFSPAEEAIDAITPVTLSSATPGAWFRYTLDGTTPTRTNGYVYCGVINVRPGMTVRAIAFHSGMADSAAVSATYPRPIPKRPAAPLPNLPKP